MSLDVQAHAANSQFLTCVLLVLLLRCSCRACIK
jgi:hypothetical protein